MCIRCVLLPSLSVTRPGSCQAPPDRPLPFPLLSIMGRDGSNKGVFQKPPKKSQAPIDNYRRRLGKYPYLFPIGWSAPSSGGSITDT